MRMPFNSMVRMRNGIARLASRIRPWEACDSQAPDRAVHHITTLATMVPVAAASNMLAATMDRALSGRWLRT
jgi:hypothetical protein